MADAQALIEASKQTSVPVEFVLPLAEEYIDRQPVFALFDAFALRDETLLAT